MRKTSITKRLRSMLMKHLKFAMAIPFKVLSALICSIFQDGKQKIYNSRLDEYHIFWDINKDFESSVS